MISITCTKCKAELTIDDGFAGLACRCRHCGTIQTVPTRLKGNASAAGARSQPAAKALYENPRGGGAEGGSGFQSLADAVVSSGLGSGRLRQPVSANAGGRKSLLLIAVAVVIVLALGAGGAWMFLRNRPAGTPLPPTASRTNLPAEPEPVPAAAGPRFADIRLEGDSVIYVLDHGGSSVDFFESMKLVTLNSIRSLGPDRTFQIIFWERDGTQEQIPAAPRAATAEAIAEATKAMEDVICNSATDPEPALRLAFSRKPAAIVLVTGKNSWLNTSVARVADAAGPTKIHCVALDAGGSILQAIAKKTGGQFKRYRPGDLRNFP